MQSWLQPAVIATLLSTVVMCVVFWYLYVVEKKRSLRLWATAWGIYALRFVCLLIMLRWKQHPLLFFGNQAAAFLSGMVLLAGNYAFVKRRFSRYNYLLVAAMLFWIALSACHPFSFRLKTAPAFFVLGLIYIQTGMLLILDRTRVRRIEVFIGVVFILWGIHKIDYPFLFPVKWFAPVGFIIGALLQLLVAVGMILLHFQRAKAELIAVQQQLVTALDEKETLLKEVHHRVKNNLQLVSSLLTLQMDQVYDRRDMDFFVESRQRVHAMALVHEKLYRSASFSRVNFKQYVFNLVSDISDSLPDRRIKITAEVDDLDLNIVQSIPCGLLINELISNALKHAFPGCKQGTVHIQCTGNGSHCCLSVQDDGIGIPDSIVSAQGETMGLTLVAALARQLKAEQQISSEHGTLFRFIFPLDSGSQPPPR